MPVAPALLAQNRLLAALSLTLQERLADAFDPVELVYRQSLVLPERPLTSVTFPLVGCVSRVTLLADGAAVEAALIGNEGMVGLPLLLGVARDTAEMIVQGPGTGLRLGAAAFVAALAEEPALREVLGRYAVARVSQLGQTAACNARHPVEQRCARWLLELADRMQRIAFPLTHEFLAEMLGVRRASVSEAAAGLQRAGLIRYQRGQVRVLDRARLELAACECYQTLAALIDRLLPWPSTSVG